MLDGVSLDFFPGDITLLAGPSGCGKSTLAACMAGLVPDLVRGAWSGSIIARKGDVEVSPFETRPAYYSTIVGLVSQNPDDQLVSFDVKEEIAFGLENLCLPASQVKARVVEVARCLGIHGLLDAPIDTLSGGEKQLVSIASQLVMGQAVMILDEPTAFLDPENRDRLLATVSSIHDTSARPGDVPSFLASDPSIIIIDHDIEHVGRVASRLVTMGSGGTITGDGGLAGRNIPPPTGAPRLAPASMAPGTPGAITLDGVDIAYGDKTVLEGVGMTVHRGEILGIAGRNGSGKTSLLLAMVGIVAPAAGRVLFDGKDLRDHEEHEFFSKVGFIFQNPEHQLFCQDTADEIRYSARNFGKPLHEDRLDALAAMIDPDPAIQGKNPFTLSWGQKRRLNIASALAHQPGVLFLDEPFIGHDEAFKESIISRLVELNAGGMTIVIVSHDERFLETRCHRVARLADRHVVVQDASGVPVP